MNYSLKIVLIWVVVLLAAVQILLGFAGYFLISQTEIWRYSSEGIFVVQTGVLLGAGLLLLSNGFDDKRILYFGVVALLIASSFSKTALIYLSDTTELVILDVVAALTLDALFPFFFWNFTRLFPKAFLTARLNTVLRSLTWVSLGIGLFLIIINLLGISYSDLQFIDTFSERNSFGAYAALTYGLAFPAIGILWFRTNNARQEEKRRVVVFVAGLLISLIPPFSSIVITSVSTRAANYVSQEEVFQFLFPLMQLFILATPIVTTYAVLVERILPARVLLKQTARYALGRLLLAGFIFSPALLLTLYFYLVRASSLSSLVVGTNGLYFFIVSATSVYFFSLRERARQYLERLFFRAKYDASWVLANLSRQITDSEDLESICAIAEKSICNTLHPEAAHILLMSAENYFRDPQHKLAAISLASPLSNWLTSPNQQFLSSKLRRELPEFEARWLVQSQALLIIPIRLSGTQLGVILLGSKKSEQAYSQNDLDFLAIAASTIGLNFHQLSTGWSVHQDTIRACYCENCKHVEEHFTNCVHCGSSLSRPILLPKVLHGQYFLKRVLGNGMTTVYLCSDVDLQRDVVLKTVQSATLEEIEFLRTEAKLMATFSHPNIASIFTYESFESMPILVCEYLEKGTLQDLIMGSDVESLDIMSIGAKIADALSYLHSRGVAHGDIKPSNIGIAKNGNPKLLDFGLSREVLPLSDIAISTESARGGTYAFLSPERIRGEEVNPTDDLWALATTLFELTYGTNPFLGDNYKDTVERILNSQKTLASLKHEVSTFFLNSLSPTSHQRPQNAEQFAHLWDNMPP